VERRGGVEALQHLRAQDDEQRGRLRGVYVRRRLPGGAKVRLQEERGCVHRTVIDNRRKNRDAIDNGRKMGATGKGTPPSPSQRMAARERVAGAAPCL